MLVHTIKDCSTHVRKKKQTKLDLCSAQLDVVFLVQSDRVIQHTLTLHCASNAAFWFSGRKKLSFCCIPIDQFRYIKIIQVYERYDGANKMQIEQH